MESFHRLINSALAREIRCRKEGDSLRLEFWRPAQFLSGNILPPDEAQMLLSGEALKRGEEFVCELLRSHRYSAPQLLDKAAKRKD
jgi:hypothetical protein